MRHSHEKFDDFYPAKNKEWTPSNKKKNAQKFVLISGREVGVTPVFYAYWYFAAERQQIFFKRVRKLNEAIYTSDPILAQYKFTNSYRASDRVSQYLIRNVIYRDDLPQTDEEIFFRILLFKIFNKIETWESLEGALGAINLDTYDFKMYDAILSQKLSDRDSIYSAAYIMPSCGKVFGYKYKHQNHLKLIEYMLDQRFPEKLRKCETMNDAYNLLLSAPSVGPFLAYQYVTDLNYSELINFSESEFVMAGPGALDGIQKCFIGLGNVSAPEIIAFMSRNQDYYFSVLSLDFQSLWGRPLQLIDCQNIFCEVSKYARVAFPSIEGTSNRKRIKQKFTIGGTLPAPWYPPKWGINSEVKQNTHFDESPGSQIARAVQPTLF